MQDAELIGLELTAEDLQGDVQGAVWPQNVAAVTAFLSIATQFRWVGSANNPARVTGLDYGAAESGLEMSGTDVTPELWGDIRRIEVGAIAALNEDRS